MEAKTGRGGEVLEERIFQQITSRLGKLSIQLGCSNILHLPFVSQLVSMSSSVLCQSLQHRASTFLVQNTSLKRMRRSTDTLSRTSVSKFLSATFTQLCKSNEGGAEGTTSHGVQHTRRAAPARPPPSQEEAEGAVGRLVYVLLY
jgi:hypothetical protein